MRNLLIIFSILLVPACQEKKVDTKIYTINPIIGDISYVKKFGESPKEGCNEQERIKIHLEYVENVLRKKSITHLTAAQTQKRISLLNHLKDYVSAGQFPSNYDYPDERRPCFMDRDGNICAVGYLVEQSAGLTSATEINNSFQYATIHKMESDLLEDWISNSGLTKNEVAMIQPTYGSRHNDKHIGYGYGVPSAILSVANIGLSTASIANWNNPNYNKRYARLGLASGILTLGFNSAYTLGSHLHYGRSNYQKKVQNINLVTSVASIGINSFRLLRSKKINKNKKISWNFNMQSGLNETPIIGFAMIKRL